MNQLSFLILTALIAVGAAHAQEVKLPPHKLPPKNPVADPETAVKTAAPGEMDLSKATQITATNEAYFDADANTAIFKGDVRVRDPQFSMRADTLTVILDKEKGGMKRAIAEGNVVIVQEGVEDEDQRAYARAAKAEYHPEKGEMVLSGKPEIKQGINLHRATEFNTRMYLRRDGEMRTVGDSVTLIQDKTSTEEQ